MTSKHRHRPRQRSLGVMRRWWALAVLGCAMLAVLLAPYAAWELSLL